MTQAIKVLLKDLNRKYFDSHIENVIWNSEKDLLRVVMNTKNESGKKDEFRFNGEEGKSIYKQLINE